ncbi:MAG: radical SAM protein [Desulfobacterota bacterium]|nr:radical SAM protein [Thermodesulfobacteriota bacterium]
MKPFKYLYGPVPSRRLGRSLGIDLVPHKVCTYDCIYCQVGRTTLKSLTRKAYVPVQEVLEEIDRFLRQGPTALDHLSLSGSGEPTLHAEIGQLIAGVKALTPIPVAVLTNGSLLYLEEVREDLREADVVLPSLDAASPEVFERINRPAEGISVEQVIEGLIRFRKVYPNQLWLELLFCHGVNDHPAELSRMKEAVERIEPDQIHLNTVVRPPAERWARPLSPAEMERIRDFFGGRAVVISEFDRHPLTMPERKVEEEILAILRRRPLSIEDLSRGMGMDREELERFLGPLLRDGKIELKRFGEDLYYGLPKKSDL